MLPIFPQSTGGITKARVEYRFRRTAKSIPIIAETYVRSGGAWAPSGNSTLVSLPNADVVANLIAEAVGREGKEVAVDTKIVITIRNPSVPMLDIIDFPGNRYLNYVFNIMFKHILILIHFMILLTSAIYFRCRERGSQID